MSAIDLFQTAALIALAIAFAIATTRLSQRIRQLRAWVAIELFEMKLQRVTDDLSARFASWGATLDPLALPDDDDDLEDGEDE